MDSVVPAPLSETDAGTVPTGDGWFILNAADAPWRHADGYGAGCTFEGQARFPQLGMNLRVLQPGEINCKYHRESAQEDFLVVAGECLVIIEGEERPLRQWDFVHCPAGTNHVFVGAGEGPCVLVAAGARPADVDIVYPVEPAAQKHGAGVAQETRSPAEAYADVTGMKVVRGQGYLEAL